MAKRTDYSKVSLKAKMPKSIRYNVKDFEAASSLSGRSTVQGLWDYLLLKYLVDMGVRQVAPIGKFDTRPVDPKIFDVSKEREFTSETKLIFEKPLREIVGGIVAPKEMTTDKEIDDWMKSVMKPKPSELMRNPPPKGSKEWFEAVQIDEPEVDNMPMWTPKPKTDKVETKAETERFAAAEMKRFADLQERAAKLKGGKKK